MVQHPGKRAGLGDPGPVPSSPSIQASGSLSMKLEGFTSSRESRHWRIPALKLKLLLRHFDWRRHFVTLTGFSESGSHWAPALPLR